MISTPNLSQGENFDQAIRVTTTSVGIDTLSKTTTRITTIIDSVISKQHHPSSQAKINPGTGEVTITIHDRLRRRDKIYPSQISAVNPDQIHVISQCLGGFETKARTKIYPTTRNSQLPTPVTSQT